MRSSAFPLLSIAIFLNTSQTIHACEKDTECPDGEWCSANSSGSNFCRPYAALGDSCNAFTLPELMGVCNPAIHKCHQSDWCRIADVGGTCVEESFRSPDGDCCSMDDECASGVCGNINDAGITRQVCTASSSSSSSVIEADVMETTDKDGGAVVVDCDSNNPCADGNFCATRSTGGSFCKPYSSLGGPCNAFTLPEFEDRCDFSIHMCYEPDYCQIADMGGTCVEKTFLYNDGDCCSSGKQCQSGVCAEGLTALGTRQNICQGKPTDPSIVEFDSDTRNECNFDDDCANDKWCLNRSSQGNKCNPYLPVGGLCNVRSINPGRCNPDIHYCYEPEWCRISDLGGSCMDKSFKFQEGDCCRSDSDCASGSCGNINEVSEVGQCAENREKDMNAKDMNAKVLNDSCRSNVDCSDGFWCANNSDDTQSCRPFAALGESCQGNVSKDLFQECNYLIHLCYKPQGCKQPDLSGICVEEEMQFEDGDCCLSDGDCLSGICSDSYDSFGTRARVCQSQDAKEDEISTPNGPCIVGDILYAHGDSIGHIGTDCIDDSFYNGVESVCQHGEIMEVNKIFSCPGAVPVCNQCGAKGRGNALCMSSPAPVATARSGTSCIVGSAFVSNADRVPSEFKDNSMDEEDEDEEDEIFANESNLDTSSSSGMGHSPILVLTIGLFILANLS